MKQNWYHKNQGNGQGLIIDEATGRNVAVAYDGKDAQLLAAAPQLLDALQQCLAFNRVLIPIIEQAYDRFTDNDMVPANHKLSLWLAKARVAMKHGEAKLAIDAIQAAGYTE